MTYTDCRRSLWTARLGAWLSSERRALGFRRRSSPPFAPRLRLKPRSPRSRAIGASTVPLWVRGTLPFSPTTTTAAITTSSAPKKRGALNYNSFSSDIERLVLFRRAQPPPSKSPSLPSALAAEEKVGAHSSNVASERIILLPQPPSPSTSPLCARNHSLAVMDARLVDLTMRYYAVLEAERDAAREEHGREEAWRRRAASNGEQSFYLNVLSAHLARATSGRVTLSHVSDAEFERCRRAVADNCREGWLEALPAGLDGVEVRREGMGRLGQKHSVVTCTSTSNT